MLMAHGYSEAVGPGEQVVVATSDGGQNWQSFVIGAAYEPRGLAYFDGRSPELRYYFCFLPNGDIHN
jgi:hypothetical protein